MTPADTMRAAAEALSLMYANSHGNTDDEISARLRARSALSLLHSALEQGEPEPVAWMRDDGRPEIWTAKDKERAIKLTGPWLDAAKHFTIPLYLASIPPNTPVEAGKVGVASGVAVPAPARYPDHTAFCCGSAHNCRQPEKSCAMRGDVLGREHERGRPADGVPGTDEGQPSPERGRFLAWCKSKGLVARFNHWEAWQAALSFKPDREPTAPEAVAWLRGDAHGVAAVAPATKEDFPYDRTFAAIAAAARPQGTRVALNVSVRRFIEAWNAYPAARVNPACGVHGSLPCEGARCICTSGVMASDEAEGWGDDEPRVVACRCPAACPVHDTPAPAAGVTGTQGDKT